MGHIDGVRNNGKRRIRLRLNAKIVVAGWDTWNHDFVVLLAFSPRAITVVAVVVAHFAAKVPGLPGVLIDERVVQINPVITDRGVGFHLHRRSASSEFENIRNERSLGFWIGAAVPIGLPKHRLFFCSHIETGYEREK